MPLGLGSLALPAAPTASVVYLPAGWTSEVPLLAVTVGTDGALALIAGVFGTVVMSMRRVISAGRLELGLANAVRRNLLVLWNLCLLMACLGWLAFGAGAATARTPIGTLATIVEILMPTVLVVYDGTVMVLVSRWLRS
ncbi:hypothetical protein GCM10017566_01690 [Amycolatopsis bartoniae]|uniref:Uncharacterized protein n=1 Tax=Amycolatopsis bartoniae TaxID=941986 RepID=A0A8H9IQB8_9PSEU|nr:hypothetical protein GCM10017566_01690 [Amycolatopsis bartoniae]